MIVRLKGKASLRLNIHQSVNSERQLAQPGVLVLWVVALDVGLVGEGSEIQLREILHSDRAGKDLNESVGISVVVDAGAMEWRPYLKNSHAARA